ncbi:carbonic anhydrase [Sphingomonas oligophenolica]|uniref:carbonic anhydrase n=1 Tax=Sphingomonas oligophenolica TaxID=301154 RepID=A0ABU9Y4D7_9SPHN
MEITRRSLIQASAGLALSTLLPLRAWADDTPGTNVTTEQALASLVEGNRKFAAGATAPALNVAGLGKLAADQHPWATIVCCSDSRVPPELIFRTGFGELFVVRNAGNTAASSQSLGSIEYSVAVLRVPLIVVLGHSDCGAVRAAKSIIDSNTAYPGSIGPMVEPILPAANAVRGQPLDNAIVQNVRSVTARLRSPEQPILYPPQRDHLLAVIGGVYDIGSGTVHYVDIPSDIHLPVDASARPH